jgi:tripartite-type tricarboxylate transporter receptor subunit TctC
MKIFGFAVALVLLCAGLGTASAQSQAAYPNRPITLYTPFPGFNDVMSRLISSHATEDLGQPFITVNLPGAGGAIAANKVKTSSPDGYTLLYGSNGMFTIYDLFNSSPQYKTNDFIPITLAYSQGLFLLAGPSVKAKNMQELIAYAKANPYQLTYGSSGVGTITHMAGELLAGMSGTKMTHVPYKGTSQALNDLIGGRISLLFFAVPDSIQYIKSGKVRALAISTKEKSRELPEVPSIAESGLPGYDMKVWYGYFAPAGTPTATVNKLSRALMTAVHASNLESRDLVSVGNTPDEFRRLIEEDKAALRKTIKDVGLVITQ